MASKTPIWYPSNDLIAQLAHFGWGALIPLATVVAKGTPALGAALTLLYATPKEFIFDIFVEKDSWVSSAIDFSVWCFGVTAAIVYTKATHG